MGIYILSWFVFFLFSLVEVNRRGSLQLQVLYKFAGVSTFLLLLFFLGFRWETGTDWKPYLAFFNFQKGVDFFSASNKQFEPGFSYFVRFSLLLSNNYTFYLCFHAFIFLNLLYISFKHLAGKYYIMAIFFYFAIFVGMTGAGRQLLAIALGTFGVMQLTLGRRIFFLFIVLIAFTLHTTAVLLLLFLFINREIKWWWWVALILTALAFGSSSLPLKIFSFGDVLGEMASNKVAAYVDGESFEGSVLGIVKRIILAGLFLYLAPKLSKNNPYYHICLNGYLISVVFFFLFAQIPVMGRANLYFNTFEPILMVYLLDLVPSRLYRNAIVFIFAIMCVFYFIQSIQLYPSAFLPYKGIWINENFFRSDI